MSITRRERREILQWLESENVFVGNHVPDQAIADAFNVIGDWISAGKEYIKDDLSISISEYEYREEYNDAVISLTIKTKGNTATRRFTLNRRISWN